MEGTKVLFRKGDLALAATSRLNQEVFERPGLPARSVGTLVRTLAELRERAGDVTER